MSFRAYLQPQPRPDLAVLYLVQNPDTGMVKLGISTIPKIRLAQHRAEGYTTLARLMPGMTWQQASEWERHLLAILRAARYTPVRGREYFPARTLADLLYLIDTLGDH